MRIPSCHMEIEQIFLQLEQQDSRSLCITSTNSGEGVSSLAQALTERHLLAGYRTLLVDLNLQNPSLIPLSFIPSDTDVAETNSHYLTFSQHNSVVLSGLAVPTNKAEIVELRQPKNLKKRIDTWLKEFDKVIIDTSAVSQLNTNNIPAQTIAGCCESTLMVILSGQTLQTELKDALEKLENHNANIIGHVFNDKYQPSLKNEICREIERLSFLPKKISTKLIAIVQKNRFLSTVV
ncbi:CpsD/CapB family tyrosine-protein kinase [Aliivibrio fischeri]|uniref:Chromosome partitioning ATPase n=1 Tax=Aliivibrio fischeri SR5 TaxID=1088719 RepID=A0AAV3EN56_ALIFS|nr:CpsD/CapB family tyrosine-protein kinase [Aliivibrio fischeri]EHN68387.1 chromosome partitioning ATPase [Aliivibrio fischeri SR5]MUJ25352.1 chromosome partitioning protein ParA [Aliivibrio fischeri]